MNLLERLSRREKDARHQSVNDFASLVTAVADGTDISEDDAAATLQLAGRSAADLQQAVATEVERRRLQLLIDGERKAEERRLAIEKRIEEEKSQYVELVAEIQKKIRELDAELNSVMGQLGKIRDARAELSRMAGPAEKISELDSRLADIEQKRAAAKLRLADQPNSGTARREMERLSADVARVNHERHALQEQIAAA